MPEGWKEVPEAERSPAAPALGGGWRPVDEPAPPQAAAEEGWPESIARGFYRFPLGVAKGAVGDVVGLGQLAGIHGPQALERWATAPSGSWAETAGDIVGGAAALALPAGWAGAAMRAGRMGSLLSRLARAYTRLPRTVRAIAGGAGAGAVQPTAGDTSHIPGAVLGGVGGAVFGPLAARAERTAARRAAETTREGQVAAREQTIAGQEAQHAAAMREFRNFEPVNLDWYRYTMQPTGMAAPTTASRQSLATMRGQIGNMLNTANSRLQFMPQAQALQTLQSIRNNVASGLITEPERQAWFNTFERHISAPIKQFGAFTGADYARFVSGMRETAEDLARAGQYQLASGLRQAMNAVEAAAVGPPAALAARKAGKEAWRRYSILSDAAPARAGNIATPSRLAAAWERRQGRNQYLATPDPMKDWLERQRRLREVDRPAKATPPPEVPELPPEPQPGRLARGVRAVGHGLGHYALWHAPGVGHAAYFLTRPLLRDLARRAGEPMPSEASLAATLGRFPSIPGTIAGQTASGIVSPAEAAEEESADGGAGAPSERREPLRIGTIHPDYY